VGSPSNEERGGPRRVPLDWDDLEIAPTWHSDEWQSYLDLRTGKVRQRRSFPFGDQREDHELADDELETGLAKDYLVHIEPLPSSVEYGWMEEFADTVTNTRLRDRLGIALDGPGAFRRFKHVLADHPAERERWFRFRDDRVREAMEEWLAEHGIEPTTRHSTKPRGLDQREAT
jgi:hypothetical protein